MKRVGRRLDTGKVVNVVLLSLYGLFIFFPMYWMITTALKGPQMVIKMPPELFPKTMTLINFERVLKTSKILTWTVNTLIVASAVTVGYTLFSTMSGYAFAQRQFPGRNILFWLFISTLMLPYFSYLVPLYLTVVDLRLVNKYWGMILPGLSGPFGVFLMKQSMTSFPSDLMQAAKIDGCNEFGGFLRVVVPVCKPAIVFLAVITFIGQWNNFLWPLIVTSSDKVRLLQVGIALFQQQNVSDFGQMMSASTLAALPVILLFLVFQRHIVGGISIGAIKG